MLLLQKAADLAHLKSYLSTLYAKISLYVIFRTDKKFQASHFHK